MMYPKGVFQEEGELTLYMNASHHVTSGPKEKTLAVYKLRVLDQLHRNHYEQKYTRWFRYDPDRLDHIWLTDYLDVPMNKLKEPSWGFLANDQIYVGVEFLLLSTTEDL
ncbi:unnamed protein product [Arabis nemorensis]|uniref:MATH domain-containing protein n=1 Tax=Arabis nemorensis TaxID=586526 RepID=A0A565C115_9BRAS|nr:unnamed protein product [Arabis nemorensis]